MSINQMDLAEFFQMYELSEVKREQCENPTEAVKLLAF